MDKGHDGNIKTQLKDFRTWYQNLKATDIQMQNTCNSKHLNASSGMIGVQPQRLSLVNLKKLRFTAAKMYIHNHLKSYRTEKGKRDIFKFCAVRVQKYIKHSSQCT